MKRKWNKYLIAGCSSVVIAGAAAAYILSSDSVEVEKARLQDVTQYVKVTGNLSAGDVETLYAPVSGRLEIRDFKAGDQVKKDELLAAYDLTMIRNDYEKAAAYQAASEDAYQAAVAENKKAQALFDRAAADTENHKAEIAEILGQMNELEWKYRGDYIPKDQYTEMLTREARTKHYQASMERNMADKTEKAAKLAAYQELKIAWDVAEGEEQEARRAYDRAFEKDPDDPATEELRLAWQEAVQMKERAKIEYNAVRRKIEKLEDDLDDLDSELENDLDGMDEENDAINLIVEKNYHVMDDEQYARYLGMQSRLKVLDIALEQSMEDKQFQESKLLNPDQIKQYQDQADMARADAANAEYALEMAKSGIVSAKNGVILEKYIYGNAMVAAGQPICMIQANDEYKVELMVSKYDIHKIALGQPAEVTAGNAKYQGTVTRIYPRAENDLTGKPKVKVEVTLEPAETAPIIGLEANVTICAKEELGVLSVPGEGVYSDDDGTYVYVLKDGRAKKQYIVVGLDGDQFDFVESGIEEGEDVIVSPFSDDMLKGRFRKK